MSRFSSVFLKNESTDLLLKQQAHIKDINSQSFRKEKEKVLKLNSSYSQNLFPNRCKTNRFKLSMRTLLQVLHFTPYDNKPCWKNYNLIMHSV